MLALGENFCASLIFFGTICRSKKLFSSLGKYSCEIIWELLSLISRYGHWDLSVVGALPTHFIIDTNKVTIMEFEEIQSIKILVSFIILTYKPSVELLNPNLEVRAKVWSFLLKLSFCMNNKEASDPAWSFFPESIMVYGLFSNC